MENVSEWDCNPQMCAFINKLVCAALTAQQDIFVGLTETRNSTWQIFADMCPTVS